MVKFITGDLLKSIRTVISRGVHSFESLFLLCKKIVRLGGQGIRSGERTVRNFKSASFFGATVTHVALGAEPTKKPAAKKWAKGQVPKKSARPERERTFFLKKQTSQILKH